MRGALVVVGLLAASVACGRALTIAPDESEGGVADGGAGGDGPLDGPGAATDGPSDDAADCASFCSPGACIGGVCQPFLHPTVAGPALSGVAATDDRIFFTSYDGNFIRVSVIGGNTTDLLGTEGRVHAIEVTGPDEIQWSKVDKGDGVSGIFKSAFDGSKRMAAASANETGVFAFARGVTTLNEHYWIAQNVGTIHHFVDGGFANEFGPPQPRVVQFMERSGGSLYWTNGETLRTAPLANPAGIVVLADTALSPFGLAVHGSWVYFTNGGTGSVHRVAVPGGKPELVAQYAGPPPTTVGDIAVTPSGRYAYWAIDDKIYGVRLPN